MVDNERNFRKKAAKKAYEYVQEIEQYGMYLKKYFLGPLEVQKRPAA